MQILAELHKNRSHRDLKPQNILVAQSKMTKGSKVTVKLIDFAASREHDEQCVLVSNTQQSGHQHCAGCLRSCRQKHPVTMLAGLGQQDLPY